MLVVMEADGAEWPFVPFNVWSVIAWAALAFACCSCASCMAGEIAMFVL